jgi:hypothetical protein
MKNRLNDLDLSGRLVLNWVLMKKYWRARTEFIGLRIGTYIGLL